MAAPTTLVAGDTLSWSTSLPDYPATAGWVLTWRLVPTTGTPYTITCSASGADHLANVAPATTAAYAPGRYTLSGTVSLSGARYTVATGQITVTPDLGAVTAGVDTRSSARQALDACDEMLRTFGEKAYLQSIAIGDRAKTFRSPGDFLAYRSRLQAEVAREQAAVTRAAGGANPARLYVRFGANR